jgi:ribosomal protein S6 kinase alpha-5
VGKLLLFSFASAYGKVYLVKKKDGFYKNKLFAMKVLKKATIVQKAKTTEHTMTERQVLEAVRSCPFLVTLHWAFQTESKLHLVMGKSTYYSAVSLNIFIVNLFFFRVLYVCQSARQRQK